MIDSTFQPLAAAVPSYLIEFIHIGLGSFTHLIDPNKRIFIGYLTLNACIVFLAFRFTRNSHSVITTKRRAWLDGTSWHDLFWLVSNHILRVALVTPLLFSQVSLAITTNTLLVTYLGQGEYLHLNAPSALILLSICVFMFEDLARYILHRLFHSIPWLWRFHAVHHSATALNPLSLYRVHSAEMLINTLRSIATIGLVSGVFMYVVDGPIGLIEIFGVNVFVFIFNSAAANLRHTPVWLSFGKLEHIFISPAQHQIHHSNTPKHFNKNYGSALAIWDKIFNSWLPSKNQTVHGFGLYEDRASIPLSKQLLGVNLNSKESQRMTKDKWN
ncbi:MAG: sterol desaturase/sphingolipid hydroxylase (fatty acid hydroxylase superfamily) [Flavobacteriales bacterium]|jgi:sterol desaturase/sphingolipid hydroxylase (fatty acid hydroxylase superfamily)